MDDLLNIETSRPLLASKGLAWFSVPEIPDPTPRLWELGAICGSPFLASRGG